MISPVDVIDFGGARELLALSRSLSLPHRKDEQQLLTSPLESVPLFLREADERKAQISLLPEDTLERKGKKGDEISQLLFSRILFDSKHLSFVRSLSLL